MHGGYIIPIPAILVLVIWWRDAIVLEYYEKLSIAFFFSILFRRF